MMTRTIAWIAGLAAVSLLGTGDASADDGKGLGVCEGVQVTKALSRFRFETTNDRVASWVGSDLGEIVASWGAPYSVFDNRDGSRIVSWKSYSCTTTVKVDPLDEVTHWNVSNGCNCITRNKLDRRYSRETPVPPMTL